MLVLSRKKNETIVVDGPAVITIVEQRGDRTRLGIEAPASTHIIRGELRTIPPPSDLQADQPGNPPPAN